MTRLLRKSGGVFAFGGTVGETIVTKGPAWITALGELTPLVAIALLLVAILVLFVWTRKINTQATIDTMKTISDAIVTPLRDSMKDSVEGLHVAVTGIQTAVDRHGQLIENHFAHDAEDRQEQTKAFVELVACIKDKEGVRQ